MNIYNEYLQWVPTKSIYNEYLQWVSSLSIYNEYIQWVSTMSIYNEYLPQFSAFSSLNCLPSFVKICTLLLNIEIVSSLCTSCPSHHFQCVYNTLEWWSRILSCSFYSACRFSLISYCHEHFWEPQWLSCPLPPSLPPPRPPLSLSLINRFVVGDWATMWYFRKCKDFWRRKTQISILSQLAIYFKNYCTHYSCVYSV